MAQPTRTPAAKGLTRNARYEAPFAYVDEHVKPERQKNNREAYRTKWWLHVEPRSGMRARLAGLPRFLVTPTVSKRRLFLWTRAPTLPDHQLIVFALADDDSLGLLHSRPHEIWARSQGTQVRERESGFRYSPTTCFETFPFPDPTAAQRAAIAEAARELDQLRTNWLNPPECFAAYGWDPSLSDDDLLAALLALNLPRAAASTPA